MGLADNGIIGHTQPRRIAARSVAERVAEELDQNIGNTVGYQVRFTSEVSSDTRLKVMTDGILLAEIQHDPNLSQYSVIIIDEAHERSLNIDFLLGYLKRLLNKRNDLKVIITSATIDPDSLPSTLLTAMATLRLLSKCRDAPIRLIFGIVRWPKNHPKMILKTTPTIWKTPAIR